MTNVSDAIRVAIVEDDELYRSELRLFLSRQPEILSVTIAGSIEEFLSEPIEYIPDIILLDIGLPGVDGVTGIPMIKAEYPNSDIIMLTLFADHQTVFNALCSGALGYVLKESRLPELKDAVMLVAGGGSYMTPSIARKVVGYFTPLRDPVTESLTDREKDVVEAIADGLSYKLIADRLSIKIATVQSYIKNIYRKLDVNSKTEAVRKFKANSNHNHF